MTPTEATTQLLTTPSMATTDTDHTNRVDAMAQSVAQLVTRNSTLPNLPNALQDLSASNTLTNSALRDMVHALVQQGDMTQAFDVAQSIPFNAYKILALRDIVHALVQQGDMTQAFDVAQSIPSNVYKILALRDIVYALVQQGDITQAVDIARSIPLNLNPSKISAFQDIHHALVQQGDMTQAFDMAQLISLASHKSSAPRDVRHTLVQQKDMTRAIDIPQETIFQQNENGTYRARRIFSDGTVEEGIMHTESRCLEEGYRIAPTNSMTSCIGAHVLAERVVSYSNPDGMRYYSRPNIQIAIILNRLVCVDVQKHHGSLHTTLVLNSRSLGEAALILASNTVQIEPIILHADFEPHRNQFFLSLCSHDAFLGVPDGLSNLWLFQEKVPQVLTLGAQYQQLHPFQVVDSLGRNLFLQAASTGAHQVLETLLTLYPNEFQTTWKEVIRVYLQHEHSIRKFQTVITFLTERGWLDEFQRLLLQICTRTLPDESFYKSFSELSTEHQQDLYAAAFQYNNPFLHEPTNPPITADRYSIHMLWVNPSPMDPNNAPEFLFGKGETVEKQRDHFQEHFVQPIARWATKNFGSTLHVWVDRLFALDAVVARSEHAVQEALSNQESAHVLFRNMRELEIVEKYPEAFCSKIPVYYRVDLLKACIADHALQTKISQFVVVTDLDVVPMSKEELFDQKTVTLLTHYGVVMTKEITSDYGFENSFQMFNQEHSIMVQEHHQTIVNGCTQRALRYGEEVSEHSVYKTYPTLFQEVIGPNALIPPSKRNPYTHMLVKPVQVPTSHFYMDQFTNPFV